MITFEEIMLVTREKKGIEISPIYRFLVSKINPEMLPTWFDNIIFNDKKITSNSSVNSLNLISNEKTFCLKITKEKQTKFLVELSHQSVKVNSLINYNLEFVTFCTENKIDLKCSDWLLNNICPKSFLRKLKLEKLNLLN
jgi:hypothetical protein